MKLLGRPTSKKRGGARFESSLAPEVKTPTRAGGYGISLLCRGGSAAS
jgi:hypothetical protein